MRNYLVQFDESNRGIAWSKGKIIEANSKEEAINKAITTTAQIWLEMDAMMKDTALYSGKNLNDYEEEYRSYDWKATKM